MEIICGIYCIENKINHKKYIGQSVNIYKRWKDHKIELNNNHHFNIHLQNAWNKYGSEAFLFSILKKCKEEELDKLEVYYIKKFNTREIQNGYNMTDGGIGTKGHHTSEEQKKILSKLYKGKKRSLEIKEKARQGLLNKIANGYMPKTDHLQLYNDQKKVSINCYDTFGNFIKQYNSVHDAARDLNIEATNISKVLKNKYKQSNGYVFYYSDIKQPTPIEIFLKTALIPIVLFDSQMNFISLFHNYSECADYLHADSSYVRKACNGLYKTVHGYIIKKYSDVYI